MDRSFLQTEVSPAQYESMTLQYYIFPHLKSIQFQLSHTLFARPFGTIESRMAVNCVCNICNQVFLEENRVVFNVMPK